MMLKSPDLKRHIADKFNPSSPEHLLYINSFYEHSHELIDIFVANPGILLKWDELMNEFNDSNPLMMELTKDHRNRMKTILDEVYSLASTQLKSKIKEHQHEIDHFPSTMAFLVFAFYFF